MKNDSNTTFRTFSLLYTLIGFLVAALLWFIMFSPLTSDKVNFWLMMSLSASALTIYSLIIRRNELRNAFQFTASDIFIGIGSAVLLYGVFYFGNMISQYIFSFAGKQIHGVYATRSQAETWLIGILLLFIIGPAEEIFWRGFAQEQLMQKMGTGNGYAITTLIYTLVHLPSLNFMLIMAALFAGLFWGWMYRWKRRLTLCIISHAMWDCSIFAVIPIIN